LGLSAGHVYLFLKEMWPKETEGGATYSQGSSWAFWQREPTKKNPTTVEKPFYLALTMAKSMDNGISPSVVDPRGNESPFYMDLLYTLKNCCAKRALISS
jgi:hypothetical protein